MRLNGLLLPRRGELFGPEPRGVRFESTHSSATRMYNAKKVSHVLRVRVLPSSLVSLPRGCGLVVYIYEYALLFWAALFGIREQFLLKGA